MPSVNRLSSWTTRPSCPFPSLYIFCALLNTLNSFSLNEIGRQVPCLQVFFFIKKNSLQSVRHSHTEREFETPLERIHEAMMLVLPTTRTLGSSIGGILAVRCKNSSGRSALHGRPGPVARFDSTTCGLTSLGPGYDVLTSDHESTMIGSELEFSA